MGIDLGLLSFLAVLIDLDVIGIITIVCFVLFCFYLQVFVLRFPMLELNTTVASKMYKPKQHLVIHVWP